MFLRFGFRAYVGLYVIRRLTLPKPFRGSKLVGVTTVEFIHVAQGLGFRVYGLGLGFEEWGLRFRLQRVLGKSHFHSAKDFFWCGNVNCHDAVLCFLQGEFGPGFQKAGPTG